MTALSNALFEIYAADIEACKAWQVKEGKKTPEEVERLPQSFFKKR